MIKIGFFKHNPRVVVKKHTHIFFGKYLLVR